MSIHPSLSASLKNKKQKSVLTRIERIKYLMDKGQFSENTSVFGLPKVKIVKLKIKKEKAADKTAAGDTATAGAATGEAQTAQAAKPAKGASPQAKPAK